VVDDHRPDPCLRAQHLADLARVPGAVEGGHDLRCRAPAVPSDPPLVDPVHRELEGRGLSEASRDAQLLERLVDQQVDRHVPDPPALAQ
jgi:hypothetical protein